MRALFHRVSEDTGVPRGMKDSYKIARALLTPLESLECS